MSRRHLLAALALALPLVPTGRSGAQDRLVGLRAIGAGAVFESVQFGGDGLLQGKLPGQDSLRVRSATQFSVPVSAAFPLGRAWTFDVSGAFASGNVTIDEIGGRQGRVLTLSGVSDVRARLSGRLLNDGVMFTAGINAPSGLTELDGEQLTALRTLAAPALGLGAPPVGSGTSGTVGLLLARQLGTWGLAIGSSYEYRGTFQPVSALVAGAPSTDFTPGGVIRVTAGLDGFVGRSRLTLSASSDIFLEDELRNPAAGTSAGDDALARVQLGPLLGLDAQLQLAVPRLREFVLWTSFRVRSAFALDGVTVDGSDARYLDGGLRLDVPVGRRTDVFATADGRWHSGLGLDEGLAHRRRDQRGWHARPLASPHAADRAAAVRARADRYADARRHGGQPTDHELLRLRRRHRARHSLLTGTHDAFSCALRTRRPIRGTRAMPHRHRPPRRRPLHRRLPVSHRRDRTGPGG